jgi:hypothetical protein
MNRLRISAPLGLTLGILGFPDGQGELSTRDNRPLPYLKKVPDNDAGETG